MEQQGGIETGSLFQTMWAEAPHGVLVTDARARIQYVNRRVSEITGYPQAELLGQNPRILQSGTTTPETYESLWRTLRDGLRWQGELKNKRADGSEYWERLTITPVVTEDGTVTHYVGLMEDITEERQQLANLETKRESLEAQRLDDFQMYNNFLTGYLNNLLTALIGQACLALDDGERAYEMRKRLGQILAIGKSGAEFTRDLQELTGLSWTRREAIEPAAVVQEAIAEIQPVLSSAVAIDVRVIGDVIPVAADRSQLKRVVHELIRNACDVSESGSQRIVVSVYSDTDPEPQEADPQDRLTIGTRPVPGTVIEVCDFGRGMDRETLARALDPGFSTKRFAKGLGLFFVRTVARQLGGQVEIVTAPDEGTRISLILPVAGGQYLH